MVLGGAFVLVHWHGRLDSADSPVDSVTASARPVSMATASMATASIAPAFTPPATASVLSVSAGKVLWQSVSELLPAPPIRSDVQNARLVKMDRQALAMTQKGDRFVFTIPQSGQHYGIDVGGIKRTQQGNRIIKGRIPGTVFTTLITLGETAIFATIGTPEGVFNLSGREDLAWLIPARELNHHVDTSYPDYIVVSQSAVTANN